MTLKIYFSHGGMDEKFMRENIVVAGKNKGIETEVLTDETVCMVKAKGIDLFLVHCSEIPSSTISLLRRNNPKAMIYGIFGGAYSLDQQTIERSYRDTYDHVFCLDKESFKEIIGTIIEPFKPTSVAK